MPAVTFISRSHILGTGPDWRICSLWRSAITPRDVHLRLDRAGRAFASAKLAARRDIFSGVGWCLLCKRRLCYIRASIARTIRSFFQEIAAGMLLLHALALDVQHQSVRILSKQRELFRWRKGPLWLAGHPMGGRTLPESRTPTPISSRENTLCGLSARLPCKTIGILHSFKDPRKSARDR